MDKKLKLYLIKEAQKNLVNNPQDLMHDVTHHYRTVLLAKDISKNILESYDNDLLEVLCWWHDVKPQDLDYKDERTAKVVAGYLASLLPKEYEENVLDSIENHEFGLNPKFIEGKILQDADKLEVLSPERLKLALESVEAELINKADLYKQVTTVIEKWIPVMPDRYNFEYSKGLHYKLLDIVEPEFESLKKYLSE